MNSTVKYTRTRTGGKVTFQGLPGSNSGTRSVREGWAGAGH